MTPMAEPSRITTWPANGLRSTSRRASGPRGPSSRASRPRGLGSRTGRPRGPSPLTGRPRDPGPLIVTTLGRTPLGPAQPRCPGHNNHHGGHSEPEAEGGHDLARADQGTQAAG